MGNPEKTDINSIQSACGHLGVGVQTIRDTRGIAELKIVSPESYDRMILRITDAQLGGDKMTVKSIERSARTLLSQRRHRVKTARAKGSLLPFKDSYY